MGQEVRLIFLADEPCDQGEPPMSAPDRDAYAELFRVALQYYVSGRAACMSGCISTTGNLLHHAVEMMLKGELSKTISLKDLKDGDKFGHWLPKCWTAFKALFSTED